MKIELPYQFSRVKANNESAIFFLENNNIPDEIS